MALKDRFLYLSSEDSSDIFPDNRPSNFTVKLPGTLNLKGLWKCALTEITYTAQFEGIRPKSLYICCDFVQPSYAGNSLFPILRKVEVPANLNMKETIFFPQNFYIKMSQDELQYLTIYIKDEELREPSFGTQPLSCSLHMQQIEE